VLKNAHNAITANSRYLHVAASVSALSGEMKSTAHARKQSTVQSAKAYHPPWLPQY